MYQAIDESSPEARAATFKPYHHVFSPAGDVLLTNGAGAKLFPHHHGVFFGFHKITYHGDKHCDVWHCLEKACQVHVKDLGSEATDDMARHAALVEWHGAEGDVFARETRSMTVWRKNLGETPAWLLEFASRVETADGEPIHLDGDPQHAGFHFRANPEVADLTAKQTYFLRTDGKGALDETRNWDHEHPDAPGNAECVDRPWNAMCFIVGGKRYTVLYLDHPDNPKPARFSERDYGRFGSYFVTDVTKDRPLDVRYRLWVQEGEMTLEQCQALSAQFVAEKSFDPVDQAASR
jgi:hypothetical protein